MNINDIITLEDGLRYVIIETILHKGIIYYVGMRVDDNDELINSFIYFKEAQENGEMFIDIITDEALMNELTDIYMSKIEEYKSEEKDS